MNKRSTLLTLAYCGISSLSLADVVLHYSFDTDFQDASGNENHGVIYDHNDDGSIIIEADAAKFSEGGMRQGDEADRVDLTTAFTPVDGAPWTITFFADLEGGAAAYGFDSSSDNSMQVIPGDNGVLRIGSGGVTYSFDLAGTVIGGSDANHYAIVANPVGVDLDGVSGDDKFVVYANGQQLIPSAGNDLTSVSVSTAITVNRLGDSGVVAYGASGDFDEFWIFDEALSSSLVTDLKNDNYFNRIHYVDVNSGASIGSQDGKTWATAFSDLQSALAAVDGAGGQIWVAEGVYYPDVASGVDSGDALASFTLGYGVRLYGGFSGDGTETQLSERDPSAHITVISGDIDQDDVNDDGNHILENFSQIVVGENSQRLFNVQDSQHVVLDGLVITAADIHEPSQASYDYRGTALYVENSGLEINDCVLVGNDARYAPLYFINSSVTISDSQIMDSNAWNTSVLKNVDGSLVVRNCLFEGNYGWKGGSIYSEGASSTLRIDQSEFSSNVSKFSRGGAINVPSGSVVISNSLFHKNVVTEKDKPNLRGGAIYIKGDTALEITHCTLADNTSIDEGGAIYSDSSVAMQINNTLVWGNTGNGGNSASIGYSTAPIIHSSMVENLDLSSLGAGNVAATNPQFWDAASGDYRPAYGSVVIDAGDTSLALLDTEDWDNEGDTDDLLLDIEGDERLVNSSVDIGAYEWSSTFTPVDGEPWTISFIADLDGGAQAYYFDSSDETVMRVRAHDDLGYNVRITIEGQEYIFDSSGIIEADSTANHYVIIANPLGEDLDSVDGDDKLTVYANGVQLEPFDGQDLTGATVSTAITVEQLGDSSGILQDLDNFWILNYALHGDLVPTLKDENDPGSIWYVNVNTPAALADQDGLSWNTAFGDLQRALAASGQYSTIWIAAGEYYPDLDAGVDSGDVSATFMMQQGMRLYGGFSGDGSEDRLSESDPGHQLTLISGDIDQDDTQVSIIGGNSHHLITVDAVTGVHIGGVSLSAGDARTAVSDKGGALLMSNAADVVCDDVNFEDNAAVTGGAVYASDSGTLTLKNCDFIKNSATSGGAIGLLYYTNLFSYDTNYHINIATNGGAIHAELYYNGGKLFFRGGEFDANSATASGGGIYLNRSFIDMERVELTGNSATNGGAVYYDGSASNPYVSLNNCVLAGNSATGDGGGLWVNMIRDTAEGVKITHCSFANNSAQTSGGALYWSSPSTNSVIQNTVIWGNSIGGDTSHVSAGVYNADQTVNYQHSVLQNIDLTAIGTGNLDGTNSVNDPMFTELAANNLRPLIGSPLIGAGGNSYLPADTLDSDEDGDVAELLPLDFLSNGRVIGTNSDIGAYEVTSDVIVVADAINLTDTTPLAEFSNVNVFSGTDQEYRYIANSSPEVASLTMLLNGQVNVTPKQQGTTTMVVQAIDDEGYTANKSITVQLVAPSVVSVTPVTSSPTSSDIVRYSVVFSEVVSGLDSFSDLSVSGTGTAGASAADFSTTNNTSYTVDLKNVVGDGELSLAMVTGENVVDSLGLGLASSLTSSAVIIDNTAPVITLVGDSSYTLTENDSWADPGSSASDTLDVSVNVVLGGESVYTGVPNTYTITYDATDSAGNSALQKSRVVTVLSYLGAWNHDSGLTAGVNDQASDDPDGDGLTNLEEFAFNYDPLSSVGESKFSHQMITEEAADYFCITFPVRFGAVFTGSSAKQSTIDSVTYTVERSDDLVVFDGEVVEVTPAQIEGLPTLSSGWEYRTFRVSNSITDNKKSFLRVKADEGT